MIVVIIEKGDPDTDTHRRMRQHRGPRRKRFCWHLQLRLAACGTRRQWMSVVHYPVCGACYAVIKSHIQYNCETPTKHTQVVTHTTQMLFWTTACISTFLKLWLSSPNFMTSLQQTTTVYWKELGNFCYLNLLPVAVSPIPICLQKGSELLRRKIAPITVQARSPPVCLCTAYLSAHCTPVSSP